VRTPEIFLPVTCGCPFSCTYLSAVFMCRTCFALHDINSRVLVFAPSKLEQEFALLICMSAACNRLNRSKLVTPMYVDQHAVELPAIVCERLATCIPAKKILH